MTVVLTFAAMAVAEFCFNLVPVSSGGTSETIFFIKLALLAIYDDLLCGVMVRVSGYRSRGLGSMPALPGFLRSSESTQPREYN
jgi:hypothetical protein